jgi:hypothetical protein
VDGPDSETQQSDRQGRGEYQEVLWSSKWEMRDIGHGVRGSWFVDNQAIGQSTISRQSRRGEEREGTDCCCREDHGVIDRTFHPLLDLIRLPKSYRLPSLAPQQRLLTARVLSTCPTSQCATDDSRQPRIPTHTHRKPLLSASFGRCTRYPSCRTTVTAPPTSCYVLPIDPKDGERE